ncbi:LAMI_0D10418g1_1 [Lachancea mirantina]|uniref:Thiamine pyrophosphokinase n=1 Tax=Lachancea mirantina TaxID=1230905 RepID=A0A1G4JEE0_9SACH|nr:LAMI_0D10418g1_1 [Lachancea mirantina]
MEKVIENEERIDIDVEVELNDCYVRLESYLRPEGQLSALLILNQKIDESLGFEKLWNAYHVHVCADGGANRLYEYLGDEIVRQKYIPHYIVGDLDSVRNEVLSYYREKGAIVIQQTSQYATDFDKCVKVLSAHFFSTNFAHSVQNSSQFNHGIDEERGILDIYTAERENWHVEKVYLLVLNAIDGRFDQTIHSITQLYTLAHRDSYYQVGYLTPSDLIFLVRSGGFTITYREKFLDQCIGNCGILPLGCPTTVLKTLGLKWDVENWSTSIESGKVSSSNRFVGRDRCYLDVQKPVVMNVELNLKKLLSYEF